MPFELKRRLADEIEQLRRGSVGDLVRWSKPATIHLTLRFLGEIDAAKASAAQSAMEQALVGVGRFTLHVGGQLGCFPKWSRPRVFWIGVSGAVESLTELVEQLEAALADRGFEREGRRYHPHLTLGRVRQGVHRSELGRLAGALRGIEMGALGTIEVGEVVLMSSDLRPEGAVHTPVHAVELGEPAA